MIGPRFVAQGARPRMRRSVIGTDIALAVLVVALCWLIGWRAYLLVGVLPAMLAGSIGIWLFYVQHQFEDAYWESGETWNYADAALRGSSFLKLPAVLRFCTGNIGFHHVHHLNARIPSYNLPRAHEENAIFHDVPTLSLGDGMRALSLKLWDEDRHRLVTFAQERASRPPAVLTVGSTREPVLGSTETVDLTVMAEQRRRRGDLRRRRADARPRCRTGHGARAARAARRGAPGRASGVRGGDPRATVTARRDVGRPAIDRTRPAGVLGQAGHPCG